MAISTYTALSAAVSDWLSRSGDTDLAARFDDFLALHEQRMYLGAKEVPGMLPAFEPLRIREMETVNSSFALAATVAQPTGFLELIEATLTSPIQPLDVVAEGVIDGYGDQSLATPKLLAISGTNFRIWPDPGSAYTAVLRYTARLTSPSATNSTNWILTNAPGLYLNGCLMQAALYTGDVEQAKIYGAMYVSEVGGLNERRRGELHSASNVRLRVRGRTP